jgi:anthranilate synthase component 1
VARLRHAGRNAPTDRPGRPTVRVTESFAIERYSHVMHIVSNVRSQLRADKDALDLFAAAFPAGTVTGTPKIRAMQIIDSLEPVARGF